jgi:hypothetical protein
MREGDERPSGSPPEGRAAILPNRHSRIAKAPFERALEIFSGMDIVSSAAGSCGSAPHESPHRDNS